MSCVYGSAVLLRLFGRESRGYDFCQEVTSSMPLYRVVDRTEAAEGMKVNIGNLHSEKLMGRGHEPRFSLPGCPIVEDVDTFSAKASADIQPADRQKGHI